MKSFLLATSVASAIALGISAPCTAAPAKKLENKETLQARKAKLESDLEAVNAKLAEFEAKDTESTSSNETTPVPSYFIGNISIDGPNSAGGVEVDLKYRNPTKGRIIKYMNLTVTPYNAVGDVQSSSIGEKTTARLQLTGPVEFQSEGDDKTSGWGPIWYNSTISCIQLSALEVIYVDGKTERFSGKALSKALAPEVNNNCRPNYKKK